MGSVVKCKESRIVLLTADEVTAAKEFAAMRVGRGDSYGDSNQHNTDKIRDDIMRGAFGELAVKAFLGDLCDPPDFTYYAQAQKSYSSDLFMNKEPVAVKTQHAVQANLYGLSWSFQLQTSQRRVDPILVNPRGKLALCVSHSKDENRVGIMAIVDAAAVIPSLLKPPSLEKLKAVKTCLYYADILSAIESGLVKDYTDELNPKRRCA